MYNSFPSYVLHASPISILVKEANVKIHSVVNSTKSICAETQPDSIYYTELRVSTSLSYSSASQLVNLRMTWDRSKRVVLCNK
jgi:hypothetical protein